jgi:hypothetical protein
MGSVMTSSTAEGLTALEAFSELPTWLTAVVTPGRVAESLRRVLAETPARDVDVLDVDVDRVRAKNDEWRLHCQVRAQTPGGPREFVLVGLVHPPQRSSFWQRDADVPFGEPGWECYLDDLHVWLTVEAADPGLPALPSLVDAEQAAELLQEVLVKAGHDVVVSGCDPQVVRYKPGSRCTIVYRMRYAGTPGPEVLVGKTHQGDKGQVAWEAMRALWASPVASGELVTLAEPLAYLPAERVLVQGPVPEERTLKDLARDAMTDGSADLLDLLRDSLSRTARALAALHGSGARYGRLVTWGQEVAEVRDVMARLATTLPHIALAADPLLERLEVVSAAICADPAVSAHHDFRPAQVLLHGDRVGFIDFDGSCMAEPALDLGRFRAKLRDIGISAPVGAGLPPSDTVVENRLQLLDDLCDHFTDAYLRHAEVTPERVALWEITDLLTGVLHAWTKVRVHRIGPRLAVLRHALLTALPPVPPLR